MNFSLLLTHAHALMHLSRKKTLPTNVKNTGCIELNILRIKCACLDFGQFKFVYFESIDSSSADIYKILL